MLEEQDLKAIAALIAESEARTSKRFDTKGCSELLSDT